MSLPAGGPEISGASGIPEVLRASNAMSEEERKARKRAYAKAYYEKHVEEIKAKHKIYRETHKEEIRSSNRRYEKAHSEEIKTRKNEYIKSNPDIKLKAQKKYRESHKEEIKIRGAEYRSRPEVAACRKEYNRKYDQEHADERKQYRHKTRKYTYVRTREWIGNNYTRMWAYRSIASHRRKGYIVSVTTEELTQLANNTEYCLYCGEKLNWAPFKGNADPLSPSVDRKDNQKDLTLENINIICVSCNRTKSARSHKEFVEYCKRIVKLYGEVD